MEDSAKIGTCVEHSRNNKYFVEFVEEREKQKAKNPAAFEGVNLEDDGAFLAYMTRRYFKDNIIASIVKIVIGLAIIIVSRILISRGGSSTMNIVSIGLFIVGIFLAPAGLIFFFSNLNCYRHYRDYVTGRDDPFMDKVIKFYS
jgi:hypothetical protein